MFEMSEEEYDGVYAMIIARRLPHLPFGVQPDHPRVIPIAERIANEAGELCGIDVYRDTRADIKAYQPTLDEVVKRHKIAQAALCDRIIVLADRRANLLDSR